MNTIGCLILLVAMIAGLFATAFRRTLIAGLVILFVAVVLIVFHVWQAYHFANSFNAALLGESEADVVALLGHPRRITDGSETPEPGIKKSRDQMTPGCVKEFWYYEFFQPSAFAFCFDADGHLINKNNWSSW
jgi:hypothetical protein